MSKNALASPKMPYKRCKILAAQMSWQHLINSAWIPTGAELTLLVNKNWLWSSLGSLVLWQSVFWQTVI